METFEADFGTPRSIVSIGKARPAYRRAIEARCDSYNPMDRMLQWRN